MLKIMFQTEEFPPALKQSDLILNRNYQTL